MAGLYPLMAGLAVALGALVVTVLILQAGRSRKAAEKAHLAHRLGRAPRERHVHRPTVEAAEGPLAHALHALLLRAGEPMTVSDLLARMLFCSAAAALVLGVLSGPFAAVVGLGAAGIPVLLVRRQAEERSAALAAQLPEAFDLMGRALRGGHALPDALQLCGREVRAPLGQELSLVADRYRLGIELRNALLELAERQTGNFDLHLFVSMVLLHQETGGNLIETLTQLSETIRERGMARQKLAALTAEVRMSAMIVGCLPFFVSGVLLWVRPNYLTPLVYSPLGQKLGILAVILVSCGFTAMRRLVQVEA